MIDLIAWVRQPALILLFLQLPFKKTKVSTVNYETFS